MDALINKVDEVKLVCCVHMALLGTNLLIKHEDLLKKISQRIVDEISLARIKVITFFFTDLICIHKFNYIFFIFRI